MERRTRRAGRVAGGRWKGEGQTRVAGMKFEREIWIFRIDWGARQMGKGMKRRRRRMEGEGEDEDEKEKEKRRYGVALFK